MMPTSPRSPQSFRTAGFPQYGWKAGMSDGAFPGHRPLKPAPGIRRLILGLPPSFAHLVVRGSYPALCRADDSMVYRLGVGLYSAPGALAPVRVVLSRSFSAYRPHPPHSQAHRDFADSATYTRCLRCAGAPRRPASGSEFSLLDMTTTVTGPLLSVGLSPTGMATILAAPDPYRQHYCIRLLPRMRAASRSSGQGWRMRAEGSQASAMLVMRSQVSRVF